MKDKDTIIKNLISKIISIGNLSTIDGGNITMDYRMFCDLISISRCGSKLISDKKSNKILSQLENNILSDIN